MGDPYVAMHQVHAHGFVVRHRPSMLKAVDSSSVPELVRGLVGQARVCEQPAHPPLERRVPVGPWRLGRQPLLSPGTDHRRVPGGRGGQARVEPNRPNPGRSQSARGLAEDTFLRTSCFSFSHPFRGIVRPLLSRGPGSRSARCTARPLACPKEEQGTRCSIPAKSEICWGDPDGS